MNIHERKAILESIRWVDEVWEFDDSDGTACDLLERVKELSHYDPLIANP